MRVKFTCRKFVFFTVMFFSLIVLIQSSQEWMVDSPRSHFPSLFIFNRKILHSPIVIDSDDDFGVSGYNFNGSGTASDPYILANYNFTSSSSYLIYIEHTSVFFEIRNNVFDGIDLSFDAIYFNNVKNGLICNNTFINHDHAISLDESQHIVVQENNITSSNRGICLYPFCSNNVITKNLMIQNNHHGILLNADSNYNTIFENLIDTIINGCGIYISGGSHNIFDNNTVVDTSASTIHVGGMNNTVSRSYFRGNGIYISHSSDHRILCNTVDASAAGNINYVGAIGLYVADRVYLFNNHVYNRPNLDCIYICEANDNIVENNTLTCNGYFGFSLYGSTSNNLVKGNNIAGTPDSWTGAFAWDDGTLNIITGNYWEEYTSPDLNGDGFVDSAYNISGGAGNHDPLPLTEPNMHTISEPLVIFPNGGEVLNGSVTIQWTKAGDSWGHDIIYEIYYYFDEHWISLADGTLGTEFLWNTTNFPEGTNYMIKVVASCSDGVSSEDCSDGLFTINNFPTTEQSTIPTISTTIETTTISPSKPFTSTISEVIDTESTTSSIEKSIPLITSFHGLSPLIIGFFLMIIFSKSHKRSE